MVKTHSQPGRRLLRFSLRALLLLVLAIGAVLGWTMLKVRQQGRAAAALEKLGCRITYADGQPASLLGGLRGLLKNGEPRNAAWLLADHSQLADADLIHLDALPQLTELHLAGTKVTDAGLARLGRLPQLRLLDLSKTRVTDAGLVCLEGLPQLEWLRLDGTQVTDAGLAHLERLTQLGLLGLGGTQASDAGLVHLAGLTEIHSLYLAGTQVSGAGLTQLRELPKLDYLLLNDTPVTDEAVDDFHTARQNLCIEY